MSENTKSQWSGQFFVAGELTRRGYWVSIPLGNAPSTDIVVVSSRGEHFRVEVKTKAADSSSWWIKTARGDKDLYFVLVVRGEGKNYPPPKYWVLTARHVRRILSRKEKEGKTAQVYKSDLGKSTREGIWDILPA